MGFYGRRHILPHSKACLQACLACLSACCRPAGRPAGWSGMAEIIKIILVRRIYHRLLLFFFLDLVWLFGLLINACLTKAAARRPVCQSARLPACLLHSLSPHSRWSKKRVVLPAIRLSSVERGRSTDVKSRSAFLWKKSGNSGKMTATDPRGFVSAGAAARILLWCYLLPSTSLG